MLGILLIYYVGKPFYFLALEHDKSKWLWAILGVVVYYLSQFVFGIGVVIACTAMGINIDFEDKATEWTLNILGIPIGIFFAWLMYKGLQKSWSNSLRESNQNILDDELINNH